MVKMLTPWGEIWRKFPNLVLRWVTIDYHFLVFSCLSSNLDLVISVLCVEVCWKTRDIWTMWLVLWGNFNNFFTFDWFSGPNWGENWFTGYPGWRLVSTLCIGHITISITCSSSASSYSTFADSFHGKKTWLILQSADLLFILHSLV